MNGDWQERHIFGMKYNMGEMGVGGLLRAACYFFNYLFIPTANPYQLINQGQTNCNQQVQLPNNGERESGEEVEI